MLYKIHKHTVDVKTTVNPNYKGVYVPEHNTILISTYTTLEELKQVITHELTHMLYDKEHMALSKVIKEYNPAKELGNFTSEAIATFIGKFGKYLFESAEVIYDDLKDIWGKEA